MFLFKDITLPSGYAEKKLREMLKTFDAPDPKRTPDRFQSIQDPEDVYRVRWTAPNQFEFKCFSYREKRYGAGYHLIDHVRVQLLGPADHPSLKVHLQKKWFDLVKLFFIFLIAFGTYLGMFFCVTQAHEKNNSVYFSLMGVAGGTIYLLSALQAMRWTDFCVTRLKHLLARDDWDPEAAKVKK